MNALSGGLVGAERVEDASMLSFIMSLFVALHPQAASVGDAKTVAHAIAYVAEHDEPIPGTTREHTAAILTVMAWHESRFRMGVVGDNGRAFCAMQIHGGEWLAKSPIGCVRTALKMLRLSAESCPQAPLAAYAGGCNSPPARRISAHRLIEADKIEAEAHRARGDAPLAVAIP
jgi:hypothetical protein